MKNIEIGHAFTVEINSDLLLCVKCTETDFITSDFKIFHYDDIKDNTVHSVIEYDKEFSRQFLEYYNSLQKRNELMDKSIKLLEERKALDETIYLLEAQARSSVYRQQYLSVVARKAEKRNGNAKLNLNLKNHLNKIKVGSVIYKTDRTIRYRSSDDDDYEIISKEQALDIILYTSHLKIISNDTDIYIN